MSLPDKKVPGFHLIGYDGNTFAIMYHFSGKAKKAGFTQEEIDAVMAEATKDDYDHLLGTFIKYVDDIEEEVE